MQLPEPALLGKTHSAIWFLFLQTWFGPFEHSLTMPPLPEQQKMHLEFPGKTHVNSRLTGNCNRTSLCSRALGPSTTARITHVLGPTSGQGPDCARTPPLQAGVSAGKQVWTS